MNEIGIEIKWSNYDNPSLSEITFTAYNGHFQGQLRYYSDLSEFEELGKALSPFPKKIPDKYSYEIGSTRAKDKFVYYFALHAYTIDKLGHSTLQIVINNYLENPYNVVFLLKQNLGQSIGLVNY